MFPAIKGFSDSLFLAERPKGENPMNDLKRIAGSRLRILYILVAVFFFMLPLIITGQTKRQVTGGEAQWRSVGGRLVFGSHRKITKAGRVKHGTVKFTGPGYVGKAYRHKGTGPYVKLIPVNPKKNQGGIPFTLEECNMNRISVKGKLQWSNKWVVYQRNAVFPEESHFVGLDKNLRDWGRFPQYFVFEGETVELEVWSGIDSEPFKTPGVESYIEFGIWYFPVTGKNGKKGTFTFSSNNNLNNNSDLKNVKVFRIKQKGQIIRLSAPLEAPMAFKFSKGLVTDQLELFVVGTAKKPIATIDPHRTMAMADGKWIDIDKYSKWSGRSRKFIHSYIGKNQKKNKRQWRFAVYIKPNEQFNVYRLTINGWRLVAYVIGMDVKVPRKPIVYRK